MLPIASQQQRAFRLVYSRLASTVALLCCLAAMPQSGVAVEFTNAEQSFINLHGPWPQAVPADPGNELSEEPWAQTLGATLFFDETLSLQKQISCATCHIPDKGFADAVPLAMGAEQGVRNTQGLLDIGQQRWFGWDGGADSLWAASLRPLLAEHEMATTIEQLANTLRETDYFTSAIQTNIGSLSSGAVASTNDKGSNTKFDQLSDEELAVLAAKSIAAYTRSLESGRTLFDNYRDALINNDVVAQQDYPESAKRGLKIFVGEANCSVCHFGPNFSNGEFHDTGRPFFTGVGQVDAGRYTGIQRVKTDPYNLLGKYAQRVTTEAQARTANVKLSQGNWGQWRTPSLRNLKSTAPYMHDGSLETLRDVVDAYADIDPERLHAAGESFLKPLDLSEEQREDLVAFLLSLSPTN